jgi:cystathionine beta-lyase
MGRSTELIHHPYRAPDAFDAPQPGVFKASTVFFPTVQAMRERDWKDKSAYTYGLHGTPTTFLLEERLCALEGGRHAVLVPSGLAAIAQTNLAFLQAGDHVLIPNNAYGPSRALAKGELDRLGVTHALYDPLSVDDLKSRITPQTRLVWLEAPGSVTLEFPDLTAMVRACQERGVLTALDNTWGAGLAFQPFDLCPGSAERLSVDVSVHALTKYPSGGGDVLMGSVMTHRDDLAQALKLSHMRLGFGVGANDAEAILRALPSMDMRYAHQDRSARELAAGVQGHPRVHQVLHPALPESPGHAHWQALCGPAGRAAGLFSLILDPALTTAQVDAFCESLRCFKLGYSWGGPVSLVVPYAWSTLRGEVPAHLKPGHLVRFSTGLEDAEDLLADLLQALSLA